MSSYKKLWIGLAILVVCCPIGLWLPEWFSAGAAWGEWSEEEIQQLVGHIPEGMRRMADLWKAPIPDYAFSESEKAGVGGMSLAYMLSAFLGVGGCLLIFWVMGRLMFTSEK